MDMAVTVPAQFWCLQQDCWGEEKGRWKSTKESRAKTSKAHFKFRAGYRPPKSLCNIRYFTANKARQCWDSWAALFSCSYYDRNDSVQPLLQIWAWWTSIATAISTLHHLAGGDFIHPPDMLEVQQGTDVLAKSWQLQQTCLSHCIYALLWITRLEYIANT